MRCASSVLGGRSDWIRTSGHLNPIQVLYQTEPHPEITCTSIQQKSKFVNPFFEKSLNFFQKFLRTKKEVLLPGVFEEKQF